MAAGLNPTLLNRFSRALRPDFTRTILARRIAAGFLVVLAAAAALRPDGAGTREVVVAARDLRPGVLLTGSDLALRAHPAAALPDGAQTVLADVLGATLAGPARRGEVLTDARMLGSRLAGLSAGPDARVVPVRLADPAVLDLVRPGDVVDVLGTPNADSAARPRLVASNAVVVLVSPESGALGADGDRVVLVALPATAASALAGASLVQTLTVTLH